jgi:hypothetical protein
MPGSVHVGFSVDKVVLGRFYSDFFGFLLSASFHHGSPYSCIIWGMSNRPVSGRSSDITSPHQHEHEQQHAFLHRAFCLGLRSLSVSITEAMKRKANYAFRMTAIFWFFSLQRIS